MPQSIVLCTYGTSSDIAIRVLVLEYSQGARKKARVAIQRAAGRSGWTKCVRRKQQHGRIAPFSRHACVALLQTGAAGCDGTGMVRRCQCASQCAIAKDRCVSTARQCQAAKRLQKSHTELGSSPRRDLLSALCRASQSCSTLGLRLGPPQHGRPRCDTRAVSEAQGHVCARLAAGIAALADLAWCPGLARRCLLTVTH